MAYPAISTRTYLYKFRLRRTASGADDCGVYLKTLRQKDAQPPGTTVGVNSAGGRFRAKDS
jgi:hypothetical protein